MTSAVNTHPDLLLHALGVRLDGFGPFARLEGQAIFRKQCACLLFLNGAVDSSCHFAFRFGWFGSRLCGRGRGSRNCGRLLFDVGLCDGRWANCSSQLGCKVDSFCTRLLTGAAVDAAGARPSPEAVWVGSVGLEIDGRAELRLLKTLLARRTSLNRRLRSPSGAPDAAGGGVLILMECSRTERRRSVLFGIKWDIR